MTGMEMLRAPLAAAYTEDCACGGTILFGTDGDGHATESCDGCGHYVVVRPTAPDGHPFVLERKAETERVLAQIIAARADMPPCARQCGRNVGHLRATICPECSEDLRREKERARKRTYAERGWRGRVA